MATNGHGRGPQEEEEEDDIDAYMKSLDIPADFLQAQQGRKQDAAVEEEDDHQAEANVVTLDDIYKLTNNEDAMEVQEESDSHARDGGGDDDKFFQALLSSTEATVKPQSPEKDELQPASTTTTNRSDTASLLEDSIEAPGEEEEKTGIESALELIAAKAKKKEIKLIDHGKVDYPPFRKNFYVEAPDVAQMSDKQIEELKEDLEITIRGKNPPRPISHWEECGLSQKLLETILANGWAKPFAIQRQALPAIMSGRDVMGVAQTGSGKTLAFLIPLLRHVKDQAPVLQGQGPIALIIVPTRELATQIQREVHRFKKPLGVDCACLYGGQNVGEQIRDLKKGVPVVVGTPGRLIDVLAMQNGRNLPLNRVTFVVLDEADRLFDMGFTPQVERVLQNVRPDRQMVMFSATFPPYVEKVAKEALHSPLHIVVGNARSGAKVSADVQQIVELRKEDDKFLRVLQLLGEWYTKGNVLIFCDSQVRVDSLYQELERAGYPALTLHAGKDQLDRDYAIKDFKNKVRTVMVATGVAGRGLDVPDLNLVINYNCPNHLEEYVHRVGRTGRAGRKGTAITFVVDPEDAKYASDLIFALKASEQPVPEFLKRMADDFATKVAAGTEKKHQSGYKTKGYAFEEGADSGGYTAQVKKIKMSYYEEIKAETVPPTGADDEEELVPSPQPAPSPPMPQQPQPQQPVVAPPAATSPPPPVPSEQPSALSEAERLQQLKKAEEIAKAKALAASLAGVIPHAATVNQPPQPTVQPPQQSRFSQRPPPPQQQQQQQRPKWAIEEVDINDLPDKVRHVINSKRSINIIETDFKVSLTVKGTLFPPGTKPPPGSKERRLHMLVEAPDAMAVKGAVAELNRVIHDEVRKLSADQAFDHLSGAAGAPGRYRI